MAGCTSAPKQPTPGPTEALQSCNLVPCRLPGRPAPGQNEDWPKAVDELEVELKACAAQVLGCIAKQNREVPLPGHLLLKPQPPDSGEASRSSN
ncbi:MULTISPECIES: Rz1-like lysis system protein LysC [Pseudomonas]|uniref:Rz1-like lysis system protein LysC n=1 Tax=Pseudomonas TaxID=286 RepID=UPI003A846A0B